MHEFLGVPDFAVHAFDFTIMLGLMVVGYVVLGLGIGFFRYFFIDK